MSIFSKKLGIDLGTTNILVYVPGRGVIMDEPSVGLAPMIVNEIFSIIKQLNAEGISIVLVEQNAAKALEIGDYFYLLDQGKRIFGGSREAILKENIIKKAYLGESAR